jgi:lipoprotein NlpI
VPSPTSTQPFVSNRTTATRSSAGGSTQYLAARFPAAIGDFTSAVKLDTTNAYAVIWLHLAHARANQVDTGEFAANAARRSASEWSASVIAFCLGKILAAQVTAAAATGNAKTQRENGCEAAFYLGQDLLLHQKTAEAAQSFDQATKLCPHTFLEYAGAQTELTRIGK